MKENESNREPVRIVIYVHGGIVQDVLAEAEGVEAMIVDYDNERAGDSPSERSFEPVEVNAEYIGKTTRRIED